MSFSFEYRRFGLSKGVSTQNIPRNSLADGAPIDAHQINLNVRCVLTKGQIRRPVDPSHTACLEDLGHSLGRARSKHRGG